jgi:hypothetical protein
MLGLVGVTETEDRIAAVTVSGVEPEMSPTTAVMVVVPTATDVALPFDPAALLIAALVISEELHVTVVVRS